ncbi:MAG TPA: hypothetical protein VH500_19095 [Nitrososphaeraceae archaeon]
MKIVGVNSNFTHMGAPALLSISVSTDLRFALDANKMPVSTTNTPVVTPNMNNSSTISLV